MYGALTIFTLGAVVAVITALLVSRPDPRPSEETTMTLRCPSRHRRRTLPGRIVAVAITVGLFAASCASDDDDPGTTITDSSLTTIPSADGAGVPLEPGSNLPPTDDDRAPSDSTGGTDLLAPADTLNGASND